MRPPRRQDGKPPEEWRFTVIEDQAAAQADVVTKLSRESVAGTAAKLTGMITAKGMRLFAVARAGLVRRLRAEWRGGAAVRIRSRMGLILRPTPDAIYRQMTAGEHLGGVSLGTRLSMLWAGCVGKR
jgi:hypothetical protein